MLVGLILIRLGWFGVGVLFGLGWFGLGLGLGGV